jgi:hypothetical protein
MHDFALPEVMLIARVTAVVRELVAARRPPSASQPFYAVEVELQALRIGIERAPYRALRNTSSLAKRAEKGKFVVS